MVIMVFIAICHVVIIARRVVNNLRVSVMNVKVVTMEDFVDTDVPQTAVKEKNPR